MGKLLIVLRTQVVLAAVGVAAHTAAVGHIVRTGVAEGFEHGIGALLLDFQQYLALGGIAVPVVFVAAEVLEALHLGTQTLAAPHVVDFAVTVLGVVTAPDVVAEVAVVQPRGTDKPRHNLVDLGVCPLAALPCPPAERHAPAVEMLAHQLRTDHVAEGIAGRGLPDVVAEVPQVLHVGSVLVGIHLLVGIVAVGAQVPVVGLAAQLDVLARSLLDSELGLGSRGGGNELRVPLAVEGEEQFLARGLDVVEPLSVGDDGHRLRLRGSLCPSPVV